MLYNVLATFVCLSSFVAAAYTWNHVYGMLSQIRPVGDGCSDGDGDGDGDAGGVDRRPLCRSFAIQC